MYKEEQEVLRSLSAKTAKDAHTELIKLGYSVSERSVRRWFSGVKRTITGTVKASDTRRVQLPAGQYVFTSAQLGTYVHEGFLSALMQYCGSNKAQLIVSTFKYNSKEDWVDHRLKEFIIDQPVQVASDLVFCGEVNVLPTAARPLSGFQSYMQAGSGIIPHAKMQMISLPRLAGSPPRFLYTTGACTLRNYSGTKSGNIADFHHVFGALSVTVKDDGAWFVRQLVAEDDGSFCDLDKLYTADGVEPGKVLSITWGDLHCEELSDTMLSTMTSINSALQPQYNFCHDVLDFGPLSYHNQNNTALRTELVLSNPNRLKLSWMLNKVTKALLALEATGPTVYVIPSNHDRHLERWLNSSLDKADLCNAELWYWLNYSQARAFSSGQPFNALRDAIKLGIPEGRRVGTLAKESVFSTDPGHVEQAQHGHLGNNGTRGSADSHRAVGTKVNIGHTHSATIIDGVYVAGCMCDLDLGYNSGPSSWSHSFIVTYGNGKRSIITVRQERVWK